MNSSTLFSWDIGHNTQNTYMDCDGLDNNFDCQEILELTEFGDVGGYLEGTVSGQLYSYGDGEIVPCNLKFRLKIH